MKKQKLWVNYRHWYDNAVAAWKRKINNNRLTRGEKLRRARLYEEALREKDV